jgi:hypothetical protein
MTSKFMRMILILSLFSFMSRKKKSTTPKLSSRLTPINGPGSVHIDRDWTPMLLDCKQRVDDIKPSQDSDSEPSDDVYQMMALMQYRFQKKAMDQQKGIEQHIDQTIDSISKTIQSNMEASQNDVITQLDKVDRELRACLVQYEQDIKAFKKDIDDRTDAFHKTLHKLEDQRIQLLERQNVFIDRIKKEQDIKKSKILQAISGLETRANAWKHQIRGNVRKREKRCEQIHNALHNMFTSPLHHRDFNMVKLE